MLTNHMPQNEEDKDDGCFRSKVAIVAHIKLLTWHSIFNE